MCPFTDLFTSFCNCIVFVSLGEFFPKFFDLGFDKIYLHNVGRNQRQWIDVFGRDVLPKLVR